MVCDRLAEDMLPHPKFCSSMGRKPINKQYWTENSKKIEEVCKELLEDKLKNAALEVKEKKKELHSKPNDSVVSIDWSWSSCG